MAIHHTYGSRTLDLMVLLLPSLYLLPLAHPSFFQKPRPLALATKSEVIEPQCDDLYVVFARGSAEPSPLGTIVGPPLKQALSIGLAPRQMSLGFLGVEYPADPLDLMYGGYQEGGKIVARMVRATLIMCPSSDIALAGYSSQGAQLIHDGSFHLTPLEREHLVAVVTFGDPLSLYQLPPPLEDRRLTFCHERDNICSGNFFSTPAFHFIYGQNTTAAAKFINERVRRKGSGRRALVRSKL